jgi:hypothetical protein
VLGIEEAVTELQALRAYKADAELRFQHLKAEADRHRLRARDLESKIKALEKQPSVLDGIDEEFLFDGLYTIQFRRPMNGGRVLVLTRRGAKPKVMRGGTVDPLLRRGVNAVSGRSRNGPKGQAQAGSAERDGR